MTTKPNDTIGNTGLRVTVDPRRCVANGKCTYAAPGVYVIDEETGIAYVDDEERATVENLFAGARACPTDAIIIEQYGRRVYPRILAPNRESNVAGE
ncbi:MAG TPA: ferredoxin [Thermomicrobiales bacterium]|nr:ferredoxin [Thermomicrobiales bacterium]